MRGPISSPVNSIQKEFNALCEKGGGRGGGPARGKVLDLLSYAGKKLNAYAYQEVAAQLNDLSDENPWHVCFAIGVSWGHMAKVDVDFSAAACRLMRDWNDPDLRTAKLFSAYRGVEVIEQSLAGGHTMFANVTLPDGLPDSLRRIQQSQDRWLGFVVGPNRPRYIGAWNATAMFMIALFAQPKLAETFKERSVMLPPSGAMFHALSYLHKTQVLLEGPSGGPLDDAGFEPGVLYENNALFEKVRLGLDDWSMIDVHSGLYMLGTGLPESEGWLHR